jgi:hypothetical protein
VEATRKLEAEEKRLKELEEIRAQVNSSYIYFTGTVPVSSAVGSRYHIELPLDLILTAQYRIYLAWPDSCIRLETGGKQRLDFYYRYIK